MPVHYHFSGAFLVVPKKWREQILARNSLVRYHWSLIEKARSEIDKCDNRRSTLKELASVASQESDRRELEKERSAWGDVRRRWDEVLSSALWHFCNHFSFRFEPHNLDKHWLPLGPADLNIYRYLWLTLPTFAFPDLPVSRWLASHHEALLDGNFRLGDLD